MPGRPIDTFIQIVTPENIAFQYEVAGPFRRLPAFLLDFVIRGVALVGVLFALAFTGVIIGSASMGIFLVVWFLLEWFYGGVFETYMNGQTPGKKLMGIRVVSVEGHPIDGVQAVMRNILRGIDFMPLLPLTAIDENLAALSIPTFMVGLVCQTVSPRFQRLGDIACGTIVVVDQRQTRPADTVVGDPRLEKIVAAIPASFMVNRQLDRALAVYIERRRRVNLVRRDEIARHLAGPLIELFGLPDDTSPDLLVCALHARETRRRDQQYAKGPQGVPA